MVGQPSGPMGPASEPPTEVASAQEAEVVARLAAGDVSMVPMLLARDHAVAVLLADAVSTRGEPSDVVSAAWRAMLRGLADHVPPRGLRAVLLGTVLRILHEEGRLDEETSLDHGAPAPESARFLPEDDRWAGWWAQDAVPWPPGWPRPELALDATRRLPLMMRVVLILHDVAGLGLEDLQEIVDATPDQIAVLLDDARDALVALNEQEFAGGHT